MSIASPYALEAEEYYCNSPPALLCARAVNGMAEAEVERFRMQVGLTEWDSELKNADEQVDLWGRRSTPREICV